MAYSPALDISVRFTAPVEDVWDAVAKPKRIARWWPNGTARLTVRKGGKVKLVTTRPAKKRDRVITGKVVRVDKQAEIVMEVNAQPRDRDSRITLIFSQLKHKSRLRIVEESRETDSIPDVVFKEARDGWREVLSALDEYLADTAKK